LSEYQTVTRVTLIQITTGLVFTQKRMYNKHMTNFFLIKPTDALISQIYFVNKIYTFRAVPLPIIRSFPLYIRIGICHAVLMTAFKHDQVGTQFQPGRA